MFFNNQKYDAYIFVFLCAIQNSLHTKPQLLCIRQSGQGTFSRVYFSHQHNCKENIFSRATLAEVGPKRIYFFPPGPEPAVGGPAYMWKVFNA